MSAARAQQLYRKSGVAGLTPAQRIEKTYTVALDACRHRNAPLLLRSLRLLDSALRYDQAPEIAQGLHRLYDHCTAATEAGDFGAAYAVLQPMLGYWRKTFALGETTGNAA